jgi:hypothetical protein
VLFFAISCSKKPESAATISAPSQPSFSTSTPSATSSVASVPEKAKKIVKKHRPANATYVNSEYGVSFSYPRKYSLQSGEKLAASSLPTSYAKPGAVQVAAVDMPDDSYPDTDFTSALLNLSVNKNISATECMQFVQTAKDGSEVKPTLVNVGKNEYSVFEQINGEGDKKSDMKYFHTFKNNACYEFALDVDTTAKSDSDLTAVDRGKVIQQLEKIVTTARIKELKPVELENADKAPSTSLPVVDMKTADTKATDAKAPIADNTEKAQVVAPEQK